MAQSQPTAGQFYCNGKTTASVWPHCHIQISVLEFRTNGRLKMKHLQVIYLFIVSWQVVVIVTRAGARIKKLFKSLVKLRETLVNFRAVMDQGKEKLDNEDNVTKDMDDDDDTQQSGDDEYAEEHTGEEVSSHYVKL